MSNAGRPSNFKWEYAEKAIEFLSKGHSLEAFAAECHTTPKTVIDWRHRYPEFAEAVDIGLSHRRKFVEDILTNVAITGKGNASAAIFLAKNWAGMNDIQVDHEGLASIYKIVRGYETYEKEQKKEENPV